MNQKFQSRTEVEAIYFDGENKFSVCEFFKGHKANIRFIHNDKDQFIHLDISVSDLNCHVLVAPETWIVLNSSDRWPRVQTLTDAQFWNNYEGPIK